MRYTNTKTEIYSSFKIRIRNLPSKQKLKTHTLKQCQEDITTGHFYKSRLYLEIGARGGKELWEQLNFACLHEGS